MTIEVKLHNGRVLPPFPEGLTGVPESLVEYMKTLHDYVRIVTEELREDVKAVALSQPGDKADVLLLEGNGDAEEEHIIAHNLEYAPVRFEVVGSSGGYGLVTTSRDRLGDVNNVYLKTTGPPGSRFAVRVY